MEYKCEVCGNIFPESEVQLIEPSPRDRSKPGSICHGCIDESFSYEGRPPNRDS
jgi:hypothetical protein